MKIYITGVAGLIGSSLAKYFILQGHQVAGCDNLIGGYESNIPPTVLFQKLDINDTFKLSCHMDSWGVPFDVVIHCAALAYEGLSVFRPIRLSLTFKYNKSVSKDRSTPLRTKLSFSNGPEILPMPPGTSGIITP